MIDLYSTSSQESHASLHESSGASGGSAGRNRRLRPREVVSRSFVLTVLILLCLLSGRATAEPRPLSDAEVAAVDVVLQYMERGPDAILDVMSASSDLRKLSQDAARDEILARIGHPEGTYWSLQAPSAIDADADSYAVFLIEFSTGIQEVLRMDLEKSEGDWAITKLRIMSEPGWMPANSPSLSAVSVPDVDPDLHRQAVALRFALGFLVALLVIAGAMLRQRAPILSSGILGIGLLVFTAEAATYIRPDLLRNPKAITSLLRIFRMEQQPSVAMTRLGHLKELRLRMQGANDGWKARARSGETESEIEQIWTAEIAMSEGRLDDAAAPLEHLVSMKENPAVELLRARIALGHDELDQASIHYANRFYHGPPSEDQMLEALLFLSSLDDAGEYVGKHEVRGGRNAALYYTAAVIASLEGERNEARAQFRHAWNLFPMERSELVRQRGYFTLRADPTIRSLTGLDRARIQDVHRPAAQGRLISIPEDAEAFSVGRYLRIFANRATLDVPGAAGRVPENVQSLSPSEWARKEKDLAAEDATRLLQHNRAQYPAYLQWRLLDVLSYLEAERRWSDIVDLTDRVFRSEDAPLIALFEPRARALAKLGRQSEARALAEHPAVSSGHVKTSSDALELLDLAAAFEEIGDFETSSQLCHVARTFSGVPDLSWKLRQLALRSDLARSTRGFTTDHFRIRITDDVETPKAIAVGNLLEAEYKRLSGLIGPVPIEDLVTNVVNWENFAGVLTGSEHVLGYYDGEIVVPLGEVQRFGQQIVAILTHELTHALIAKRTEDRAPRWFHEGVAMRLELQDVQENVFAIIDPDELPALETLDASFEGAIDPSRMATAYLESLSFIHYLESAYGPDVIDWLLSGYVRDDSSWGAVEELTGKSIEELDVEFREWGRSHQTNFKTAQPWPYMQFYSPPLDPELRKAIRFSRDRSSE